MSSGPLACIACGGRDTHISETIAAETIVSAWRRDDEAMGVAGGRERTEALLSALPAWVAFHRCRLCGVEMAVPAIVWSAATYPRDQSYPFRWEFNRCLDDLGSQPIDLLEIGCGTGEFLTAASARGHRAYGIDFNESAVAEAKRRGGQAFAGGFPELAVHLGHDRRFDAIACFHVIEHMPSPQALFDTMKGWLRPSGRLFISCPGPRRFTRLIAEQQAGASDFWDYPPQHVLRWTEAGLRSVLSRNGWQPLSVVKEPFSWTAAGSQIGVVRASYRRQVDRPCLRRLNIARGWLTLLLHPRQRAGVSLYASALRA